jgi:hypothetical protein
MREGRGGERREEGGERGEEGRTSTEAVASTDERSRAAMHVHVIR